MLLSVASATTDMGGSSLVKKRKGATAAVSSVASALALAVKDWGGALSATDYSACLAAASRAIGSKKQYLRQTWS